MSRKRSVFRIDITDLEIDSQALISMVWEILQAVPTKELERYFRLLLIWGMAKNESKAMVLKVLNPALNQKDIADVCGIRTRSLRRYPKFQRLIRLFKKSNGTLPRGEKDADGNLEMWDD